MHQIVLAVTGASGSIYARVLLDKLVILRDQVEAVALVMTENAKKVWETELGQEDFSRYPFPFYAPDDFSAPFASGSSRFDTLIICPCSMGTLGRIASGVSTDLISRTADVMLKEKRKLICVIRDTPFNLIHIRNMATVTEAGGIICPASPSFYSRPVTLEAIASTVVDRLIDLAGLTQETFRWGTGNPKPSQENRNA
ncbi:MAG TPA: UbiX family flavin prenyltransferase [Chitinophagaceae bacterium]|nr:UbiX family flavin prenyltransferase [Chitinophagaceae bacterium]